MKKLFCFLLFLCILHSVHSQSFEWGKNFSISSYYTTFNGNCNSGTFYYYNAGKQSMRTDRSGNCFVFGNYFWSLNVEGTQLNPSCTNSTCMDFFLAKYDSSGNLLWMKTVSSTSQETISGIEVDVNGDCYVAGTFNGTITLGTHSQTSNNQDAFLAKISSAGTWQWVKSFGSPMGYDCGSSVALDRFGNIFLAGSFSGQALIPTGSGNAVIISANDDIQVFIAKYNSAGILSWVRTGGSPTSAGPNPNVPSGDFATDIITDHMGNAFISGSYQNNAVFGSVSLTANNISNGFILKYNPAGTILWGINPGTEVKAIAIDPSGNLYYTGIFNSPCTIGGNSFVPFQLTHNDIFIGKILSSGTNDWTKVLGSYETHFGGVPPYPNDDQVMDITLDNAGNVFLAGVLGDTTVSPSVCNINTVLGRIPNTPYPNVKKLPYLIKLNNAGDCVWNILARDTGGANGNWSGILNSVEVDPWGAVYFSGRRQVSINSNSARLFFCKNNDTVNPIGSIWDTVLNTFIHREFIVKLRDAQSIFSDSISKSAYCIGDSIKIPFRRIGNFANNNVFTAQLSDSSGGFENPLNLGSINGNQSDTIRTIIPFSVKPSLNYRIRVNSNLPAITGHVSGFYITVSGLPLSSAGNDATICRGDSITLNGNGGNSYEWMPDKWITDKSQKNTRAYPDSTTEYILTAINPGGCKDLDTVKITVVPRAIAKTINDTSICLKDSIELNPLNSVSSLTYLWKPSAGLSDSSIENPKASPVISSIYKLYVSNPYCQDSAEVNITVNALPSLQISNDTNICSGDSVILSAVSDASIFDWSPSATIQNHSISNTKAKALTNTFYTIKVTNSNACFSKDSMQVTVHAKPGINMISSQSICYGDSILLTTISTGTSFSWSPSSGLNSNIISSPYAFPATDTRYILTSGLGNCYDTASVFIKVKPAPLAEAGKDSTVCKFEKIKLNASGGITYKWDFNPALTNLNSSAPELIPVIGSAYFVTVTDSAGCKAKDSVTISVNLLPDANAGNDTSICFGSKLKLNGSGGIDYSWTPLSNIDNVNISDPLVNPFDDELYKVRVKDINGCFAEDSILIIVRNPVKADAGKDEELCLGTSVKLKASGGLLYNWSPFQGLDDPDTDQPTASALNNITYTVKVTDKYSCVGYDSLVIKILPLPIAYAGKDTTVCRGNLLTLKSQAPAAEYLWSTGESKSSVNIYPDKATEIKLKVRDQNCWSNWDEIKISIALDPWISYTLNPEKTVVNSMVRFTNQSVGASSFHWDFGDSLGYSDEKDPMYSYRKAGSFPITLTGTTENGCKASATLRSVLIGADFSIFIPTAFTPNGNGLNDRFRIEYSGVENMSGEIFNTIGQRIHSWHSSELPYSWWDGTYLGENVSSGVYIYVIKVKTLSGDTELIKGTVTLLR